MLILKLLQMRSTFGWSLSNLAAMLRPNLLVYRDLCRWLDERAERPDDVQEVCNYVDALTYARRETAMPKGLPLSTRLLCQVHKRLMKGVRGSDKQPGELRRSQNRVGGIVSSLTRNIFAS